MRKPLLNVSCLGFRQNLGIGYSHKKAHVCLDTDAPKQRFCEAGETVYGSVLDIPYPSRTFGAVTCFHMLEHLNSIGDARHAIAELERVTAPGGVFILVLDTPSAPNGTKTIAFELHRSPVASSFAITMFVHPALWRYAMRNHRRSSRG